MSLLPQLIVNSLIAGSIYALTSAGLCLTYGLLRILNFAHGHLMMVGVYLFYLFSVVLGFGILGSATLTCGSTILVAFLTLKIFVLPFSRLSFILTLVTTLALSNILEAVVSMAFGVNVKSLSPGIAAQSIEYKSIYITPIQIIIILSAIIILSLIAFIIHHSSLGRRIRALSELPHAAESIGISATRTSYLVFTTGVLLAAYSGILVGYETNMQPTMGSGYTIKAFAAIVLGGLGNLWGTIVGSYLLGLIENLSIGLDFGSYSITAGYKDASAFVIILLVLLFRPQGLFTKRKRVA